jgi:CRISPR-associated exonuclease Cas4
MPEMTLNEEAAEFAPLPISALNHLVFCERRCALIHVEGVFEENVYTLEGTFAHETADTPGYQNEKGVRVERALPLYSRRLLLSGRADIVEFRRQGKLLIPCPVDYKRGAKHKWENDDVQLCAQALCLEEMLNVAVPSGAIFHGASRRRREINFTEALRRDTNAAIRRLHELIREARVPAAFYEPKCEGCSLKQICLPELPSKPVLGTQLFRIEED